MEIRKATSHDFPVLVEIWFDASIKAHNFISEEYWMENKVTMKNVYLPMSDVYLAVDGGNIHGFIALLEYKVAAIFIAPAQQGKGIGTLLMTYAQNIKDYLELNVYQKNENSIKFYQSIGFNIVEEAVDSATQTKEFVMCWKK